MTHSELLWINDSATVYAEVNVTVSAIHGTPASAEERMQEGRREGRGSQVFPQKSAGREGTLSLVQKVMFDVPDSKRLFS